MFWVPVFDDNDGDGFPPVLRGVFYRRSAIGYTDRGGYAGIYGGLQNGIQPTFLALGQAKISLFIAVLRKIILLIPLAIILPRFFGVMGVYYAEPISDVISAATATTLFLLNIKKILSVEALEKIH